MINAIYEMFPSEDFLSADGFDSAILGVESNTMVLIYSVQKCVDILCEDMSREDAIEYLEFNVFHTYCGEKTPIWCYDLV